MRSIKMFGLAALVALMAMTVVGAPAAMAEPAALCGLDFEKEEANEEECEPIVHVHETSVGKAKLLTSIGTIECETLFLGDEVEEAEATLELKGNFTYTNCGSCEINEENGPAVVRLLYIEHETGEVSVKGLIKVICGSSINCAFNTEGLKGTVKGALLSTQENGDFSSQGQTINKEVGGFLCPKTTKLDITTTPLKSTFVKQEHCVSGALYFVYFNGRCSFDSRNNRGEFKKMFR